MTDSTLKTWPNATVTLWPVPKICQDSPYSALDERPLTRVLPLNYAA